MKTYFDLEKLINTDYEEENKGLSNRLPLILSLVILFTSGLLVYTHTYHTFFSALSSIFLAAGSYVLLDIIYYKLSNKKVRGIVTNRSSQERTDSVVYNHEISYKVNNEIFSEYEKNSSSDKYEIGKEIIIYLNPTDFSNYKIISPLLLGLGIIFFCSRLGLNLMFIFRL